MLKKVTLIILPLLLLMSFNSDTQKSKNKTFKKGEVAKYRLHYGIFTAGEATISVEPNYTIRKGKKHYNLNVKGKSTGAFSKIINIDDYWQSIVDTTSLKPIQSFREIREAKYYLKETVDFKNNEALVTREKKDKSKNSKSHEIPNQVYDMVSGYYYLRNIDYNKLSINDTTSVDAFFENELYHFTISYKGTETIKTKLGKVKAHKIIPIMPGNKMFDGEDSIVMWLSADKNQLPLKVKAKMFVGAVEIEIKSFDGLKHDLKFEK